MADFLAEKVREIRDRVLEIEPLVREHERLRAALDALDSATQPPSARDTTTRTRTGVAAGSRAASRPGRRETNEPTRADKLVALATQQPGMTIAEAAKAMDVAPNGLYQVVRKLVGEGRLRKDGTGLFATAEQTPADIEAEAPAEQAAPSGRQQQDERVSDQDGGNGGQPDETADSRSSERAAESHNPQEGTVSAEPAPDARPSADESVEEQGGDDAPDDRPTRETRARSSRGRSRRKRVDSD